MKVIGRSKMLNMGDKKVIVLNDEVIRSLTLKDGDTVTIFCDEDEVVLKKSMPGHGGGGSGTGKQTGGRTIGGG